MNLDPRLVASFVIAILFDIVFPVVVGFYIRRRYGVGWRIFLYGALIFFLFQLITRVPAVQIIQALLAPSLQASPLLRNAWLVTLALTAGLFEEIGRYVGYRFFIRRRLNWRVALMFGAGHGGLESILLVGGLTILGLVNVIVVSRFDPAQVGVTTPEGVLAFEQARAQIAAVDWWTPFLGAYERFITLFFHIALSVLVLQTFLRRSWLWLGLAIVLHAALDLVAVFFGPALGAVGAEALLTVSLPVSLFIIRHFRSDETVSLGPEPSDTPALVPDSTTPPPPSLPVS